MLLYNNVISIDVSCIYAIKSVVSAALFNLI
jgi:hypothetical protein